MARHRNIEEEFRAIAPQGRRGIPSAQPIAVGMTGSGGADSTASMSQASQEISQLEAQFRAAGGSDSGEYAGACRTTRSSHDGHVDSGVDRQSGERVFWAAAWGFFRRLLSGMLRLFGVGQEAAPAPLPYYTPPPSVQMNDTLRSATPSAAPASSAARVLAREAASGASSAAPQVTVNVSAMDSQSFMDRSSDIASAVREAMLNLHPINDVVASL